MRKFAFLLLTVLCFLITALTPSDAQAEASSNQPKKVKSGYVIYKGFQEGRGDEPKSGYGYEYLQQLAYYANWQYDYVYGNFGELLEKLKKGEIDVMGNVSYTPKRAESISFPLEEQGREYYYLYVREGRTDIKFEDPATISGKTIGVNKGSVQEEYLRKWLQENRIEANIIPYSNGNLRNQDAINGVIDLNVAPPVMDSNKVKQHLRSIGKIGFSSYYVAVNKNRPDLLQDLNMAHSKILQADRFYNDRIYLKYYGDTAVTLSDLDKTNLTWLASKNNPFTVGYVEGFLPYADSDDNKNDLVGILAVYREHMRRRYDIDIQTKGYSDYEEIRKALAKGEVDAIYPFYCNYWTAESNGLMVTEPLTDGFLVLLYKDFYDVHTRNVIAVSKQSPMQKYYIRANYPNAKVYEVDTLENCIKAVLDGKANCTVMSSDTYYAYRNTLDGMEDLNIITTGFEVPVGFAVQGGNREAFSFIRKSMTGLSYSDISKSMIEGGYAIPEPSLTHFLRRHIYMVMLSGFLLTLLLAGFGMHYVMTKRREATLCQYNLELNKKIYIDFATGLPNKNKCEEMLAAAGPITEPTACFMFDLNDLKVVNDTQGHEMGDMMIYSFANLLRQVVPCQYFIGRFGGDEFIMIAEHISGKREIKDLLRDIDELISFYNKNNKDFQLSYSSGYAFSEEHKGATLAELLHFADDAMYANKKAFKAKRDKGH